MRKVNYRSDFDFVLRLLDCRGDDIGFPDYDWEARFYTRGNRANAYVASCKGGECVNCFNDGGRVHVVVNAPRLGLGELFVDFKASLPNSIYPDEHQDEMAPLSTGIELVRGAALCPCSADVELVLPYVKFRYEDLTDEERAELMRPAVEAAARAEEVMRVAEKAESERAKQEEARKGAEELRVSAEASRVEAEEARKAAEQGRVAAENGRVSAEEARVEAERERATEFESWQTELDGKANRTELSNILGNDTEGHIEAIEPGIVTEALRKVPQTLTPEEQAVVKGNIGVSKMELFCDLFSNAAGSYGYARMTDGEFDCELNGLKLTYEEAVAIYYQGTFDSRNSSGKNFTQRTNLPITASWASGTIAESFNSDSFVMDVEVALLASKHSSSTRFSAYPISIYNKPFWPRLVKIIGVIDFHFARAQINWFVNAVNLEEVQITRLAWSINLSSCSRLSLESFQYMIKEAYTDPGSNHDRVITVHPDVYSKLTDESNTEWHKVLTDASAKNISFATV